MQEPVPVSVAVVYALTDEVKPLLKEASLRSKIILKGVLIQFAKFRGVDVVFCRTGIGIANAHEAAERLLEHARPRVILSLGCAGATHPDLKTGDVVVPAEIRSETPGDRFSTSPKERSELEHLLREEKIPYGVDPLMTLWKMGKKTDKEEAGSKGAACVDMETAAVVAVAEKAGIPLVSLRVIFDSLDEELPFTEPFDENRPLRFLFKNPQMLLKAPTYARWGRTCRNHLFRVAARFIDTRLPR